MAEGQGSVATQQIHTVVLDIRTSIAHRPDTRWTFFQDPVMLEDALGRKLPIPSEYDLSLLDTILKHRFRTGPGASQVCAGDYQILDSRERQRVFTSGFRLRPGSSLIMTILIGRPPVVLSDETCPMPRCRSTMTTVVAGGGRTWSALKPNRDFPFTR